ncbi:uncharacterized protein LOC111397097 [Olea europaea var. sylvestris]|uniref:uncharacterized protein LOC111397097 n=1 Tax=Olea europaea var. sylvestris TaxID=158386 RepID=UPI000C1D0552|nr:uncharacterized protein LOC111397097 [Olea europaea var. sylvestris]
MAVQYLDFPENSLNLHKFKKQPQKITNLKSFWAFLLSIFIYISIFYIFNLSPSTVLSTTKFWFFISNTIILIIAADFGSFSASKENDFFEDYFKNARTRNISSVRTQKIPYDQKEDITDPKLPEEKIIEMAVHVPVPLPVAHKTTETKEEDKQIIIANENVENLNEKRQEIDQKNGAGQEKEKKKKAKCVRFNSEKILIAAEEEEKFVLQRSLSDMDEGRVEENEFSAMSDEELNRRVEEFIRRFNRQIRDQAVKNKH